jgi:phage baseplate assembly protein W
MKLGFGNAHFGISFFGIGEPDQGTSLPENKGPARWVDSDTGDFSIDETGAFRNMPSVRQRVYMSIATATNSIAGQETFGSELHLIDKIDSKFQTRINAAVIKALLPMTRDGVISLGTIETSKRSGGRVEITISYTDLITQDKDNASIIL